MNKIRPTKAPKFLQSFARVFPLFTSRCTYVCTSSIRRGLTLIEILVAMTIALILFGSVATTLLLILRVSKNHEIELNAVANARTALEKLSSEIKEANRAPGSTAFFGLNIPQTYGDGIDNDSDRRVDEEEPNGLDDDADWGTRASNDQHAQAQGLYERPHGVGVPDLGDLGVDEDCVFHLDQIAFRITPFLDPTYLYEDILYEVTTFEGQDRVLVRRSDRLTLPSGTIETTIAPLAYNVLSFNCLYWDPNAPPELQYWLETWSSTEYHRAPGFEIPATILAELAVWADRAPIEQYSNGQGVQVLALRTAINIENVIQDAAFPRTP